MRVQILRIGRRVAELGSVQCRHAIVLVPCGNDGEPILCRLRGGCCAVAQYGESVGVADWFGGFCAVFEGSAGVDNGEDKEVAPKRKRRGRALKADPKQVRLQKYREISPTPCCSSFSNCVCAEIRRFTLSQFADKRSALLRSIW